MSNFNTHVYAVVRVKVKETNSAGKTPLEMADAIATAVSGSVDQCSLVMKFDKWNG